MRERCSYEAAPQMRCTKPARRGGRCKLHPYRSGALHLKACRQCGGLGRVTLERIQPSTGMDDFGDYTSQEDCLTCGGRGTVSPGQSRRSF